MKVLEPEVHLTELFMMDLQLKRRSTKSEDKKEVVDVVLVRSSLFSS